MSNDMGSPIDKILDRSSGWRIFVFGIVCIIIASIVNYYESSPTAIALAVLGLFLMIRGYSDYSDEIKKDQMDDDV
jgi:uncharacterized membrane protein HdeD (DUF308 family)